MDIEQEVNELYTSIKAGLDRTPSGLLAELDYRCQWLARSAELLADAQVILDKKRGQIAESFIGTEESWNIVKHLIESRSSNEKRLFILTERLNTTLTHQIEAIRSLLSFEKESMKNT